MTLGRQERLEQGKRHRSGKRNRKKRPLAAHKAFAPLLGAWGALLGGLATMAVAPAIFAQSIRGTLVAALGIPSQPVLAVFMAAVLGTALLGLAAVLHHHARKRVRGVKLAERAIRRVRPIDPLRDLGTKSLDDPLEAMPFATPAWRDADLETDAAVPAPLADPLPAPEPAPAPEPVPAPEPAAAAVAASASGPAPAPARRAAVSRSDKAFVSALRAMRPAPPRPAPGTAALSRLRAVPPSELSLLEMVERFAGALHEHRAASPAGSLDAAELAARETALAEALKALAALSADTASRGIAMRADEPLRAAAAGLPVQRRMERGAA